jgi:hypothetical protein
MDGNITPAGLIATLVFFSLFGDDHPGPRETAESKEVRPAVAISNSIYFKAFETNNAALFLNCYTIDCLVIAAGTETLKRNKGMN